MTKTVMVGQDSSGLMAAIQLLSATGYDMPDLRHPPIQSVPRYSKVRFADPHPHPHQGARERARRIRHSLRPRRYMNTLQVGC
jgi:hypothetical protein